MKAKIRKTGEVVEVIAYNCDMRRSSIDNVTYIDRKGNEHDRELGLNFHWDFEPLDTDANIDWEQRKYEIAKDVLVGLITRSNIIDNFDTKATLAIKYADALIAELKKK